MGLIELVIIITYLYTVDKELINLAEELQC